MRIKGRVYMKVATVERIGQPIIEKQIVCEVLEGDPDLNERLTVKYTIKGKEEIKVVDSHAYSQWEIPMTHL